MANTIQNDKFKFQTVANTRQMVPAKKSKKKSQTCSKKILKLFHTLCPYSSERIQHGNRLMLACCAEEPCKLKNAHDPKHSKCDFFLSDQNPSERCVFVSSFLCVQAKEHSLGRWSCTVSAALAGCALGAPQPMVPLQIIRRSWH